MKTGATGDDLVKASLPLLAAKYGTWDYFSRLAPREIGYMAAELTGSKRTPPQTPPEAW
jgi:hypothetical protein